MTTGCTCNQPGFCQRHKLHKSEWWHHLCRTHQGYFQAWEEGHGPGQGIVKANATHVASGMPSLGSQAWNLTKSLALFVADVCRLVSSEEYARRLGICDGCELRYGTRCRMCGCTLVLKAKGRRWHCPIKKW